MARRRRKKRVEEPLTDELLEELMDAPDVRAFVAKNRLKERTLPEYLQQLLKEKGLVRSEVVRAAGIQSTYGYQIFTGQRKPARDYVIALAFTMGLTLKEADRLMQAAGVNQLYAKSRRDAVIIYCLTHGATLHEADEELYRLGERTVSK